MPVRTLSRVLTQALTRLEDDLLASVDPEETRRTASALATLAGVYAKVTQATTFEEDLTDLKRETKELHDLIAAEGRGRHPSEPPSAPAPDVN
jgi:hypothetical protein